jgi:hypothetical protein
LPARSDLRGAAGAGGKPTPSRAARNSCFQSLDAKTRRLVQKILTDIRTLCYR